LDLLNSLIKKLFVIPVFMKSQGRDSFIEYFFSAALYISIPEISDAFSHIAKLNLSLHPSRYAPFLYAL